LDFFECSDNFGSGNYQSVPQKIGTTIYTSSMVPGARKTGLQDNDEENSIEPG